MFTAKYKLEILAAYDAAPDGEKGALLRREGFFSDSSSEYAGQFRVGWGAVENCERELVAERMAGWQEKYPDVEVRRVVTRDRPVRCLLNHAVDAQLLVVGSRGRGGLSGMLLGSTSQALMYHAPCPLLVVRPAATP